MKEFVEFIVKALVDFPDRVQVTASEKDRVELIELRVDPSDFGKVIGKQGRTCSAIRALLQCAAGKTGHRVILEIIEPLGRERPPLEEQKAESAPPPAEDQT
ncbi:MAG: KH domain-containing protein [Verrucomicrobia bacterium]|nr:KH domain-containing protein [Verrucomicrobiota bacterium]